MQKQLTQPKAPWEPSRYGDFAKPRDAVAPRACPQCARRDKLPSCPACKGAENGLPRLRSLIGNELVAVWRQAEISATAGRNSTPGGRFVVKVGDYVVARVDSPGLVTVEEAEPPSEETTTSRLPITGMGETCAGLELIGRKLLHFFYTGENPLTDPRKSVQ